MRVGIYYAPAQRDPLWQLASHWLGRDAETGETIAQPDLACIAEITADARGYGFHATLKPPMRLLPHVSWDMMVTRACDLAATVAPFDLPPLEVADLRGFLAIVTPVKAGPLQDFCDACVRELDDLRAPPSEEELIKRRRAKLTQRQDAHLTRWGYPYVFDTWFFHMTLTRRLTEAEQEVYLPAARAMFGDTIKAPRRVTDLCLYTQETEGAPFMLVERLPLLG